ncbi:MAG: PucR family transcriptional regulator [Micromonosporaceae bacterium]
MLPTLAEVLALDVVRRGEPSVLAGADRLDAPVRWVHAIELADAARLLRGGELVLATGIGLPDAPDLLTRYVAGLQEVGASGLMVELGRRYVRSLPAALVGAARAHGLPLISLARETPFVEITEAVHARIIDTQTAELRASGHLHEVFTQLAIAGAPAEEIVRQAAVLAGKPVILESLAHQVLACESATADPSVLLAGFQAKARAVAITGRTVYDAASGWLVTIAGARGEDWGRLILVCGGPPAPRDVVLIERAATTLALTRLIERRRDSLERQAHGTVLAGILADSYPDPQEAALRTRALGVPVAGRTLVGVVIRADEMGPGLLAHARGMEAAEAAAAACRQARVPALIGSLDDVRVGALLSLPAHVNLDSVLTRLAHDLTGRSVASSAGPVIPLIAAGSPAASFRDVRRSFLEAIQVADAAAAEPDRRLFYRLPDLRLRGLLHALRDDARVQTFAERELGPLLAYDDAHGTRLTETLAAYLDTGANKAEAAKRAGVARPTLYQRLRQIEEVLGTDLRSARSRLSLHVALAIREPAGVERAVERK